MSDLEAELMRLLVDKPHVSAWKIDEDEIVIYLSYDDPSVKGLAQAFAAQNGKKVRFEWLPEVTIV